MRVLARSLLHCDQQLVSSIQRATQWTEEKSAFAIKCDHNDPVHCQ
jgi:hypothetical protein